VLERKPPIFPISALGSNFNPQNTPCIPAVKILARLELEKIFRFSFRHYLSRRLSKSFINKNDGKCLVKNEMAKKCAVTFLPARRTLRAIVSYATQVATTQAQKKIQYTSVHI